MTKIIITLILIVVNWDSNNNFSSVLDIFKKSNIQSFSKEYEEAVERIFNLSKGIGSGGDSWVTWATKMGYADENLLSLCSDLDTGKTNIDAVKASLENAGKSTSAFGAAFKSALANIGISLAINAGIQLIAYIADQLIETREEIEEAAKAAQSAIDTTRENFDSMESTVNNVKDRYAELAQGIKQTSSSIKNVNLTPDEYEEFLSLSNQLAETCPSLVAGYDSQGNAILNLKGNVDDIISSFDTFIEKQREAANVEIAEQMPDLFKGTVQDSNDIKAEIKNLEAQKATFENYRNDIQNSSFISSLKSGLKSRSIAIEDLDYSALKEYKDALNELGLNYVESYQYGFEGAVTGFTLSIQSSNNDIESAINSLDNNLVGNISDRYMESIGEIQEQLATKQQELNQTWTSMSDEMLAAISTNSNYKILSDQAKEAFQTVFNSIDFSSLNIDSWEGMESWLDTNVIQQLNSDGVQQAFADMFDIQEALEEGTISVQEYLDTIAAQFSDDGVFSGFDENVRNAIKEAFQYTSSDGATINDMIANVKAKISDEMDGAIESLSLDDLELAYNISSDGSMTFDELQKKIEQTRQLAEQGFDINDRSSLEAYNATSETKTHRADYDSYTAMMKEAQELYQAGEIGEERFKAAAKAFSEHGMDDAADWAENYAHLNRYFTEGSEGLEKFVEKISTFKDSSGEAFATWDKESSSWKLNLSEMESLATQMHMPLEMINVLLEGLQTYGFTDDYFGNMDDGVTHLTSLYTQLAEEEARYQELLNDPTAEGTEIDAQKDKVDALRESIETTKTGLQQLLDQLNNGALEEEYNAAKDGAQQIVDAWNELNSSDENKSKDSYDYIAQSIKEAAAQYEEEYGIKINFEGDTASIDTTLEEIEKDISKYENELSKLKEANGGKLSLDDSEVKEATDNLTAAYQEKQKLEDETIMSIDTSSLSDSVGTVIAKIQEWKDAYNELENLKQLQSLGVEVDTSDAESKLSSLTADLENLQKDGAINAQVLATLDIDPSTMTPEAIASQIGNLTVDVIPQIQELSTEELMADGIIDWANNVTPLTKAQTNANGTIKWANIVSSLAWNVLNKTGTITYKTVVKSGTQINGTAHSNGTANTISTAYANGSIGMALWDNYFSSKIGSAYVKGDWRLPHDETALVGEVGSELLVRDGKAQLIGANGAEFKGLKKGDIIFNSQQTTDLLKHGYITGRGRAIGFNSHVMGTVNAYAGGSRGSFGGYQATAASTATSKNSSGSSTATKANTKAVTSNTSSVDALTDKFDSYEDWIARYIDAFDRQYSQMERMANDLQDAYSKQNSTINQMISSITKFQGQYQNMYDTYMQKAYDSGLSATYQKKVIDGTISIESITDEALQAKIEEFTKWYEKACDVQEKVQELNVELKELYNQKLENIEDDFDRIVNYYDTMTDRLSGIIEMRKTVGRDKDGKIIEPYTNKSTSTNFEQYYNSMLSNTLTSLDLLYKKYDELNAELTRLVKNGQIQQYSDDWFEWQIKLEEVYQAVDDAKIQYEEIQDELREYHWEPFNENIATLDYNIQEFEDVLDHLNSDNFVDELGNITTEGEANIALIGAVLGNYKQKLADYTAAVKKLDQELKNGIINQEQYTEYLREYLTEIRDASGAIDDYKDKLIDLYKTQMEAENQALQKNISLRKEAFNKKKEYYEYDKQIREKSKDVNALRAQIAALEGVTSASGKAELARLEAQLAESQQDLDDTKSDHYFDTISQGYDAIADKADEAYDAVLDALTRSTEKQEEVVNMMLESIKTSYKDAYAEIAKTITNAGIILSNPTQSTVDSLGTSSGASNVSNAAQTPNSNVTASSTASSIKTTVDKAATVNQNAVTSVSLNKTSATIAVGGTVALTATVKPAGTTSQVAWSSNNTGVATVSGGTVTGKKAGTAKITATCGGKTATCTITVKAAATTSSSNSSSSSSTSNLKTATNTTGHYLRSAAGYGGKVLATMPKGSKVSLLGDKKKADGLTWYKVQYGNKTGWTSSYYLKFAKGTKRVNEDQWAMINERGSEMIVSPSMGTILLPYDGKNEKGTMKYLNAGDGVIDHNSTMNLLEMAKLGANGFAEKLKQDMGLFNVPNLAKNMESNSYQFGDYYVTINPTQKLDRREMQNIGDYCYEYWFKQMRKDQLACGIKHR